MSTTTILSLPNELLASTYSLLLPDFLNTDRHYICASPLVPPSDHAFLSFKNTSQHLRNLVSAKRLTTEYTYTSSGTGSNHPHLKNASAAADLLHWLDKLDKLDNGTSNIRKLHLEMYAPELLLLFAPSAAVALLELPLDRGDWTQVANRLRSLHLNRLTIKILAQTCPGPCSAGRRNYSELYADGSAHTHFVSDPVWAIKSVLETLVPCLSARCDVQFLTAYAGGATGSGTALSAAELERIKACSWNMLHSAVNSWHYCDALDLYTSSSKNSTPIEPAPALGNWNDAAPYTTGAKGGAECKDKWDWSCFPVVDDSRQDVEGEGEDLGRQASCGIHACGEMVGGDDWEAVDEPKTCRFPVVFVNAGRKLEQGHGVREPSVESGLMLGLPSLGI